MNKIDRFQGDMKWLSNFQEAEIVHMERIYPTTEHLFQALKTTNIKEREEIRTASTPSLAKKLGRQCTIRPDWEEVKDSIMFQALLCKFTQHYDLYVKLLKTGTAYLEEGNNWGDQYWGTVNGVGKNHLGLLLMKVRDILQNGAKI